MTIHNSSGYWKLFWTSMTLRQLLLASMLLASTFIVRAQDCAANDTSPICEDMRMQSRFDQVDKDLNAVYQQIIKQISVPKGEYLDYPALKIKFIDAQRQWVRFRDAECDAWYVVNEAGAERNQDQMSCLIDRTTDRIKQLKAWQAYLP